MFNRSRPTWGYCLKVDILNQVFDQYYKLIIWNRYQFYSVFNDKSTLEYHTTLLNPKIQN